MPLLFVHKFNLEWNVSTLGPYQTLKYIKNNMKDERIHEQNKSLSMSTWNSQFIVSLPVGIGNKSLII